MNLTSPPSQVFGLTDVEAYIGVSVDIRFPCGVRLMGQDIAEYGGVFKVTDGLVKEFGKERVRNTPICEAEPSSKS